MKNLKYWYFNFWRVALVVVLSGINNYLWTILLGMLPDNTICNTIRIIGYILAYICSPIAFGWIFLKNTGKTSSNVISLIIPTVLLWLLMSVAFYYTRGNDGIGFSIMFMNFPGYFIMRYAMNLIPNISFNETPFLEYVFMSSTVVLSVFLAFIGLFIKCKKQKYTA